MEIQIKQSTFNTLKVAFFLISVLLIAGILLLLSRDGKPSRTIAIENCVPTFYDGDGPYYLTNSPLRDNLAPDNDTAQRIKITGKLYNTDCTKIIANAIIDIWHADSTGNYRDEWYRGQITTNDQGEFSFETVMPKGYGEGTGYRPPHIHYKIRVQDKLLVTSEMFFEDTRDKPGFNNAYIVTLSPDGSYLVGDYNIVVPNYL